MRPARASRRTTTGRAAPAIGSVGLTVSACATFVPSGCLGAINPFAPERASSTIFCPEGEKDVDTLGKHGLPAFAFGGSSDIPDGCEGFVCGRDVVLLAEGDRVPADAVLISASNLAADESLLTGESVPVRKMAADGSPPMQPPGGDDLPFVYSGTLGTGAANYTLTNVQSGSY